MPKFQMLSSSTFTLFIFYCLIINTDYEGSDEDAKAYYVKILTSVLDSKEAVEKAIGMIYTVADSDEQGFLATLNNAQASSLSANPHVHSVVEQGTLLPVNLKYYVIYTDKPKKDPEAYYTEILKLTLGSKERAKKALVSYNLSGTFSALLPPSPANHMCENYVCSPSIMLYTRT